MAIVARDWSHTDELSSLSVCEVVRPFCEVVSSEDTTGPVTGMAISALDKLLCAGLISELSKWSSHHSVTLHSLCQNHPYPLLLTVSGW